jgi:hypothetical protein
MRWFITTCLVFTACAEAEVLPSDAAPPWIGIFASDVTPGQRVTIESYGATPGARMVFAASSQMVQGATCPPALGGVCLDLVQPTILGSAVADAAGEAQVRTMVPAGVPVGSMVYVQAVEVAGAASIASFVWWAQVMDPACPQTIADFRAETINIRSCNRDADCGTVLQGTSCGCTRDWVARNNVNTQPFYQLLQDAQACGVELISTCDCPQTYGFDCVNQICTWDYTP